MMNTTSAAPVSAPALTTPAVPPASSAPSFTPAHQRRVVDALRAVLPEHCVLFNEEDTLPYECDGLAAYAQLPMVVVLPNTEVMNKSPSLS